MSITATWMVLAVIALRFLLKKSPKYIRCFLWGLVALRLMVPFSFESVLSLVPSREPVPQEILYSPTPGDVTSNGAIDIGIPALDQAVNSAISETMTPQAGFSINPLQVWMSLATFLWLCGMVLILLYGLVAYWRIHRRVSVSVSIGSGIWICDYIDSPFILGIFRPRIFLPSSLESQDAAYVLSHERAHLKRKDHWWKPLGFLLLAVYWFNPMLWIAYILFCRDIELACDEQVIRNMDIPDKKGYSLALLHCSLPRHMIAACPLAFGEVGVKARVKHIVHYQKPGFWILAVTILLSIAAAVCLMTDPVEEISVFPSVSGEVTYENCAWDTHAMNGIGSLNERYRLLVCSDFDSQFVSFFDPQVIGNDLILGCRYQGDQLGAAWFEMEAGEWKLRSCHRFEDFEKTAQEGVYSLELDTNENSYALYLAASQAVTPGQLPSLEETRQQVLLNAAKEPAIFELPPDTVAPDSLFFEPQYFGNDRFLGCQSNGQYKLLHYAKQALGPYRFDALYDFAPEAMLSDGGTLPVVTIPTNAGDWKFVLIDDPTVSGIQCLGSYDHYIRISRWPSVIHLDAANWSNGKINIQLTEEIPPVLDLVVDRKGTPTFRETEMITEDTQYMSHFLVCYDDGTHTPGAYETISHPEAQTLARLLAESTFHSIEQPQDQISNMDLMIYLDNGQRYPDKVYTLYLRHLEDYVLLKLFEGEPSQRPGKPSWFRVENEALNDFLIGLCDNSRREGDFFPGS